MDEQNLIEKILPNKKKYKSYSFLFIIVLNACLGLFFFGYQLAVYNNIQNVFEELFKWNTQERLIYNGLMNFLMPVGAFTGSLISPKFTNNFGRIKTFLILDAISIFCMILQIVSSNLHLILIMRFMIGNLVGLNTICVPLYINEIVPYDLTVYFGSFCQIIFSVGIFFSYFLGIFLPDNLSHGPYIWKIILGFPVLVCLLRLFLTLFFLNVESPLYLLSKNKINECNNTLEKIYYEEFVEEVNFFSFFNYFFFIFSPKLKLYF